MGKEHVRKKLYGRMRVWEFPDQYIIEPTEGVFGDILIVSKADGSMKLVDELPHYSSVRSPKIHTIFGVIGMLKLLAGSYLFVITERSNGGSYLGHPIFKVSSMKILPCNQSLNSSPADYKRMENEFSSILKAAKGTTGLFFSYDVNLTISAQRFHGLPDESKSLPLWKQAEPRFMWNSHMMEVLIENKVGVLFVIDRRDGWFDSYLLPVVQGSFQHFQTASGDETVDITLIARRCTRRTGTRMWRRGADPDGYVANFVETEQILQFKGYTASFVQIRGTMPFLWEQIVDLTYKPPYEIINSEEAHRVAERHFLDLKKRYGAVVAVDLVNTHGAEGQLCDMYGKAVQPIVGDDFRFVHFDFHKICGHVHFERLSILYGEIEDFLYTKEYFLLNELGEKEEEQHGAIRTNCVDCLDRTNVTQSMIGRKMLERQLRRLGVFSAKETVSSRPSFDRHYKIMWANHGDDISTQYSGTPALKGDFVRFGKRTTQGILNDGYNALARYYLNNFRDGTRQDSMDLLAGRYIVAPNREMTIQPHKSGFEAIASLPVALSMIIAGFFFALMSLKQARYDLWHLLLSMMWSSVTVAIAAYVGANGRTFCNRPLLLKPRS